MRKAEQNFNVDITSHVNGAGSEGIKLSFGGKDDSALYLDSPQARALASCLIQRAYHIDVKNSRKQTGS